MWRVNEARQGKGSLDYTKLSYASPEVASIKYATNYGQVKAAEPGSSTRSSSSSEKKTDSPNVVSSSATWALIMDRTVGNCLEQQSAFLASTWLHALLVPNNGPAQAATCATIYVVSRALYPWLFWCGHPWLQVSTCPGYWVIWYQLYRVVSASAIARF